MLEADLSERRVARSNADSETERVTLAVPLLGQSVDALAHIERQSHGALGMLGARKRVVENDHDSVAEEPLERTLVAEDEHAQALMVLVQHCHDFFRLRALGKGGKAAQIAEYH